MGRDDVTRTRRFWAVPTALLPTLLMVGLLTATAAASGAGSPAGGSQVVEITVTAGR
ncbi:MAG: hypothetical protein M3N21_05290 [Actinomycetota bacterium]|nr:hypothetical protein [Actinomycetota bacterium]